jgi:hypothetical protein
MLKIRLDMLDPKIEKFLSGGKREVTTIADLTSLPKDELKVGMFVTVTSPEITNYQLTHISEPMSLSNWEELTIKTTSESITDIPRISWGMRH